MRRFDLLVLMSLTGIGVSACGSTGYLHDAPLGSADNPVLADSPRGEREYLHRLRCSDGKKPEFVRGGSTDASRDGHILDVYLIQCSAGETEAYIDMYHGQEKTAEPLPGLSLAKSDPCGSDLFCGGSHLLGAAEGTAAESSDVDRPGPRLRTFTTAKGNSSELKGASTVSVWTSEPEDRSIIVQEIRLRLPSVAIVEGDACARAAIQYFVRGEGRGVPSASAGFSLDAHVHAQGYGCDTTTALDWEDEGNSRIDMASRFAESFCRLLQ